jgi:hypothetical protein
MGGQNDILLSWKPARPEIRHIPRSPKRTDLTVNALPCKSALGLVSFIDTRFKK